MFAESDGVLVVVPSIAGDLSVLEEMRREAEEAGAELVIVANSRRLMEALAARALPYVTSQSNSGFAASVALAAGRRQWSWLLILNDDIEFAVGDLRRAIDYVRDAAADSELIHLDDDIPREVPGVTGVLLSITMVSNVIRKLNLRAIGKRRTIPARRMYMSFSAVAIPRAVWEAVGGLDTRYGFTYEDSDFARRALSLGYSIRRVDTPLLHHRHSVSTGRWVHRVLPVSAYSALDYLAKWYGRRALFRTLLIFCLGIRIPIALVALPRKRLQMAGIRGAIVALARDRPPSLPEWELI